MSAADELRAVEAELVPSPDQLDDLGNGCRFAEQWRGQAVHVLEWRSWATWDGMRWRTDVGGKRVGKMAQQTVQAIKAEADQIADQAFELRMTMPPDAAPEEFERLKVLERRAAAVAGHAKSSARLQRRDAMIESASQLDGMAISVDLLDRELHLLNTPSGIVDLHTGELSAHDPARWQTKITGADHDPVAECPAWSEFLRRFTGGDRDLADWLQRVVGLAATGNRGERLLPVLNGRGGTGKTTLVETLLRVLGDYAVAGDSAVILSDKREGGPSEEIAALRGARLVGLPDLPAGTLSTGRVKRLTGGDTITAHRKYGHIFSFQPSHTFLLDCNVRPRVREHTQAVWDRVRLIPCESRFVGAGQLSRDEVTALFDAEAAGILGWIVAGAMAWHADGLGAEPDTVRAATAGYRAEEDVLGQWIADCCDTSDQAAWTASSELLKAHNEWREREGHGRPASAVGFGRDLAELGFERHQQRRKWGYGLKVLQS